MLADEVPDPRDNLSHDGFGTDLLDRRLPDDDEIVPKSYQPRPVEAEVIEPVRETKFTADGSYDITEPAELPEEKPAKPKQATVQTDQPCRRCGYNLVGLPRDGRCPECGTPIPKFSRRQQKDQLFLSNPDWLRTLALGCLLVLWAGVVMFVSGLAFAFVSIPPIVDAALSVAITVTAAAGFWLLATPDPSGIDASPKMRLALRILALAGLLLSLVTFLNTVVTSKGGLAAGTQTPTALILLSLEVLWLCIFPLSAGYIRELAYRGNDPPLQDRAGQSMVALWLLLLGFGGVLGLFIALSLLGGGLDLVSGFAIGCLGLVLVLLTIGFGGIYIVMLGEAATFFRGKADDADEAIGRGPDRRKAFAEREREIAELRRTRHTERIGL